MQTGLMQNNSATPQVMRAEGPPPHVEWHKFSMKALKFTNFRAFIMNALKFVYTGGGGPSVVEGPVPGHMWHMPKSGTDCNTQSVKSVAVLTMSVPYKGMDILYMHYRPCV